MKKSKSKIAIIGGGIAGSSIALYLGEVGLKAGLEVTLFEKKESLVSGPPICHLHAGGNLYREISDTQCINLLHESIELAKLYPLAVDHRPTVIAIPTYDNGLPEELFKRLDLLKNEYTQLVKRDDSNKVLGEPQYYYKIFFQKELEELAKRENILKPKTLDEWMIPVAKNLEYDKVKFPLIMVQEYGLNIFRLAASATLSLENLQNTSVKLQSQVLDINEYENTFDLTYMYKNEICQENFDYIINAAGFRTGDIDDMLGFTRERLVEFKAAYVTQWDTNLMWPEMIFHGVRGTPNGMGQFTPYADGCVQLHGMTQDITLFENGLVHSTQSSAQPKLEDSFVKKIDEGWCEEETYERSVRAIEHLSKFIPAFSKAKVVSQPLYGAQQIPGNDPSLRAVGVSFEGKRYARCENVKASSVLGMADEILAELVSLRMVDQKLLKFRDFKSTNSYGNEKLTQCATNFCAQRAYPLAMGKQYNNYVSF